MSEIKIIKSVKELQRVRALFNEVQHFPSGMKRITYEENKLNELSQYVEFLECNILKIVELTQYSYLDILYTWYDWFTKFMFCYEAIQGKDESMRQAQFKIIEAIDIEATLENTEVDNVLLESLEKDISYRD